MNDSPTLVFGDDGSPAADIAWLFINSQRWPGWSLDIVTAHMPEVLGTALPAEDVQLHPWTPPTPRTMYAEAEFTQVSQLTAESDPRLVLSRECDLLVIGPHGNGFLKAMHLGSTADWLMLRPPAPLLVARHGKQVRTVVVCADGSPHADLAISTVAALPFAAQLDVTVLAVDDFRVDVGEAIRQAKAKLEPAVAKLDVQTYTGKPTAIIYEYLKTAKPDLVALGTRGLTGLKHLRLGSTATAIARSADCSVLLTSAADQ